MDRAFLERYGVELPKMRDGFNEYQFEINRSFFKEFEHTLVEEGEVALTVTIQKYNTHLDALFNFEGYIQLLCDRCDSPYPHKISIQKRVIFTYDAKMEFDNHEVIVIGRNENLISFVDEIYDFIHLSIPMRKVPEASVHECPPYVQKILGLNQESDTEDETQTDPRWEALEKLKKTKNKK